MAPYEQKTDSREFQAGGRSPSAAGTADPTDIIIRLWGLQGYNRPGSLTWNSDSVCVYMIADLVAASLGRIANESPSIMAAHFDSCGQALVAAKRIQTTILEFLSGGPGEAVGAAILMHQPGSTAIRMTPDRLRESLAQARPGQILFPENLAQRLRDVPGIEFKAVPAMTSTGAESGLMELVWTTPEQGARLQSLVPEEPPEPKPPAPSMGATMMVNTPMLAPRRGETGDMVRPSTRDFVAPPNTGTNPQAPVTGTSRMEVAPTQQETTDEAASALMQGLDEEKPFLTRGRILIGVVGVVLLAALVTVLYWPVPPSKARVPASETYVPNPSTNANPVKPAPEPPVNKPEPPVQPNGGTTPVTVTPKPKPKPNTVTHQATKPPIVDIPAPQPPPLPAPVESVDGFTKKDIPILLKMARTDVGNGRYNDARNEYHKILLLQPDNQDAKDGMQKLDRIKKDSDEQ